MTIYIKQETDPSKDTTSLKDIESYSLRRKSTPRSRSISDESDSSTRLLNRYRQSMDVSNDLLRTIDEVEREKQQQQQQPDADLVEESYDQSPAPLTATAATLAPPVSSAERDKKRYQRTMTPNTLRSKLQEKLISSLDTNELAGTIASIQIPPKEGSDSNTSLCRPPPDDSSSTGESETGLPPCGPRRPRKTSRAGLNDDGPTDKIEIDSENIETPPVTRRAYGSRPFRLGRDADDSTSSVRSAPSSADMSASANRTNAADDDEFGDGRFDRFSSVRRTRRLRKAPEGAEEDSSNLEPRKSPEGVEDPEDMSNPDVIVGMEVKKVSLYLLIPSFLYFSLPAFISLVLPLSISRLISHLIQIKLGKLHKRTVLYFKLFSFNLKD